MNFSSRHAAHALRLFVVTVLAAGGSQFVGEASAAGAAFAGDLAGLSAAQDDGALIASVKKMIRMADETDLAAIREALVSVATSGSAEDCGRLAACSLLRLCAAESYAEALIPLLVDANLSHAARLALDGVPGDVVDAALIDALDRAPDVETRLGLVSSLAGRRSARVVQALVEQAGSADITVARAAIRALGAAGTPRRLEVLNSMKVSPELESVVASALIDAASRALDEGGEIEDALDLGDEDSLPLATRIAAFRILVRASGIDRVAVIADGFESGDAWLREAAAGAIGFLEPGAGRRKLVERAAAFPVRSRVMLINGMTGRGFVEVLPLVRSSIDAAEVELRLAAINALGALGGTTDLPTLLKAAAGEGAAAEAAVNALGSISGSGVDELLVETFADPASPVRERLPTVFSMRRTEGALGPLLAAASDAAPEFAIEVYRAVASLAEIEAVPDLLVRWSSAGGRVRPAIERAVVAIGRDAENDDAVVRLLRDEWQRANPSDRDRLVAMIAAVGGGEAVAFLEPLVDAAPPDDTAFRSLVARAGSEAFALLEKLSQRNDLGGSERASAWKAMYRIFEAQEPWPITEVISLAERCLATAQGAENRRAVIAHLDGMMREENIALLELWVDDPEVGADARRAIGSIEEFFRE